MSKRERYLRAVFNKAGASSAGNRYVPRAYGRHTTGWGVWDSQQSRFIETKELLALDLDTVINANVAH